MTCSLSAGVITAGGCLGILIPPSVLLIVYGATAGVSVVQLYAGAFFPGIMLASLYIRLCGRRCQAQSAHGSAAADGGTPYRLAAGQ
jgi:TRAP-type C4-dicarboxylate transport system permease large subunit